MLILLPPSEGKTRPIDGPPLDLDGLSFPRLARVREQVARTLVRVSATKNGARTLGLGPTQAGQLEVNVDLFGAPCARADAVFTGVLFGELDLASLDQAARAQADRTIAIASGAFGLVRPSDLIPAYRLSGDVSLPRLGPVASRWKPVVPRTIDEASDGGLVVDLRSGVYVGFGKAPADRSVTVRVLHEANGNRTVVSHFNKATKGRIVRALLTSGVEPADPASFADALRDLGWTVEGESGQLDVITR